MTILNQYLSCSQNSTSSSSSTLTDYGEAETSHCSTSGFVSLTAPKNLIDNEEITKVLDRLKISDNAATMLASAFIKGAHLLATMILHLYIIC